MVNPRQSASGPFLTAAALALLLPVLHGVRYVDVETAVPLEDQTGSIVAPFATIQAAVDSLEAAALAGTIYIAPGTYPETVDVASGQQFVGLTSNRAPATLPLITSITSTGAVTVSLALLGVTTLTTSGAVIASLCTLTTCALAGSLTASQCTVGVLSCTTVASALSCSFQGAITLTSTTGTSNFSGACQFLAAADITGPGGTSTVTFDGESNSRFRAVANTLTSVATVLIRSRAASAVVSVAVPALLAATTGEVAVNVSAVLELAGITTADAVVANPPVAALAPGVGLNNGHYCSCRVTATNVITFTFVGALTGGAVNFIVTKLT